MEVHVYALCWNEEKMLPFFFRHYDQIADRYFIFDNDSTDNSLSILNSHPKVTVNRFEVKGGSLIESALAQFNHFWKHSRGKADWIIVCEIDEHLYHPNLREYLQDCTSNGITLVVPEGYEMVSDTFPENDEVLHESIRYGVREPFFMDKPQIFNPDEIREINFTAGRHSAYPTGNVKKPEHKEVLLLHYKYIGFHYVSSRMSELRKGLRETDLVKKWGIHYLWDEQKKLQIYEKLKKEAVKVL